MSGFFITSKIILLFQNFRYGIPFFFQFLLRRGHLGLAEFINLQPLHDLVIAILASDGAED